MAHDKCSKKGKNKRWYKIKSNIKGIDIFGEPIKLLYKGNDTIRSFPGGCLTGIVLLIIMLFAYGKSVRLTDDVTV